MTAREILTQSQQWHSWHLRVLPISILQDWFSRSSKECTIGFGEGVRRYTTIGIRLAGFLTLRPGGEWGVHGVQPSVQHHFPRTYLLVQSRAPSWSRAQVENGSSETWTVRACRRIIKITPSIWLWEKPTCTCYLPELPVLQTRPPSPAGRECLFLEHGSSSRESYCWIPLAQAFG